MGQMKNLELQLQEADHPVYQIILLLKQIKESYNF
jgi:hypothetical protein